MQIVAKQTVKKAKRGDVEAFGEIFQATHQRIFNFLLHHARDREVAADLTQETYIRAFSALKTLKSSKALLSWLHQIALNLYRDEIKKGRLNTQSLEQTLGDDDESRTLEIADWTNHPENALTDAEMRSVLQDAIQSLPDIHKTVVIMHHIEGMEVAEIAEALEVKQGTVMSRLARARETLKHKLTSYMDEDQ